MKRCLLLIFLIAPLAIIAQTQLGFRASSGSSSIKLSPIKDQRALYGIVDGGLLIRSYQTKYVGFQGEFNLSQRGYRLLLEDAAFFKRQNTYLEIPILMQVQLPGKRLMAQINAGCYGAFLLESSVGSNESGSYQMSRYRFNILRDNRFDYGILGGVGVGIQISRVLLVAEYRLLFGLGDLYKYSYGGNPSQSQQMSQSLGLSIIFNVLSKNKKKEFLPSYDIIEPNT